MFNVLPATLNRRASRTLSPWGLRHRAWTDVVRYPCSTMDSYALKEMDDARAERYPAETSADTLIRNPWHDAPHQHRRPLTLSLSVPIP